MSEMRQMRIERDELRAERDKLRAEVERLRDQRDRARAGVMLAMRLHLVGSDRTTMADIDAALAD